jgi:hypothetical protein
MLLEKLVAAGIGNRPVVFVTHRLVWLLEKNTTSCSDFVFQLQFSNVLDT